ncbi:MAG TPA: DUF3631 domain-containing protein [Candidatus Sulfotelmatobacter sp.]|nr:DUF3631 domain-containing protein [Candidatus Sulfotelmatobacter sp.]
MKNQIENKITEIQSQSIIFEPVTPHPEPVAIGDLLTEIEAVIKRHVVLPDTAATALAVWVLHTYVYESRDTVAYVAIESPEKRCGKTTLLTVLAAMANKPLIASNVTVGALFRAIDTCRPTLFIDEADTFLSGNNTMRGVINSGNTWRTAYVLRTTKSKPNRSVHESKREPGHLEFRIPNSEFRIQESSDSGLKRYSCWCPKVIAMIGKVPDTIADRSIVVRMARKLTAETRAPLSELDATIIKAKCARFAMDEGQKIARSEKIRGQGLNDRAADTFDPLYVIARLAGKHWEEKLHATALAICPGGSESSAAELLLDIYSIFLGTGRRKIFTRTLAELLRDGEEATITSAALKDPSINEQKISELLRAYGIRPSPCRIGKEVARGYTPEDFVDALKRYVPAADLEARTQEVERQNKLLEEADNFAEDMKRFRRANGVEDEVE